MSELIMALGTRSNLQRFFTSVSAKNADLTNPKVTHSEIKAFSEADVPDGIEAAHQALANDLMRPGVFEMASKLDNELSTFSLDDMMGLANLYTGNHTQEPILDYRDFDLLKETSKPSAPEKLKPKKLLKGEGAPLIS